MLSKTSSRLIAHDGKLYDGSQAATGTPLPATDEQVRRDINGLLVRHSQRELPVVKVKPKKEPKLPKERKPRTPRKKEEKSLL